MKSEKIETEPINVNIFFIFTLDTKPFKNKFIHNELCKVANIYLF